MDSRGTLAEWGSCAMLSSFAIHSVTRLSRRPYIYLINVSNRLDALKGALGIKVTDI
jgi:hypothetical protein